MGGAVFKGRTESLLSASYHVGTFSFVNSFELSKSLCSTSPDNLNINDSSREGTSKIFLVEYHKDSPSLKQAPFSPSGRTSRTKDPKLTDGSGGQ